MDNENMNTDDEDDLDDPTVNWEKEIWDNLRNDLYYVISDVAISMAIERYKQSMIDYMVFTGELKSANAFVENKDWIIRPEGDRYEEIIEDIWKHEMRHPTLTVEYLEGSKQIRKDKKVKVDSFDLTVNEHALIFWYANEAGHFWIFKSERQKRVYYIENHTLSFKEDSLKTLVNKYEGWKDRCESGLLLRIYPFLESRYFNGLAYLHRDQERYRRSKLFSHENSNEEE